MRHEDVAVEFAVELQRLLVDIDDGSAVEFIHGTGGQVRAGHGEGPVGRHETARLEDGERRREFYDGEDRAAVEQRMFGRHPGPGEFQIVARGASHERQERRSAAKFLVDVLLAAGEPVDQDNSDVPFGI